MEALGGGGRAAGGTGGGSGGGWRRNGPAFSKLPAELRDSGSGKGKVGPRMFARHQAVPDGGGASHQGVARIFKPFSGFG